MMAKGMESLIYVDWIRHKFTKSRIPDKVRIRVEGGGLTLLFF